MTTETPQRAPRPQAHQIDTEHGFRFDDATNGVWLGGERGFGTIGRTFPGGEVQTTAEMIQAAGLDWSVRQQPLSEVAPLDGAERYLMNVREDTNTILGVVGKGWRNPSNTEAFGLVDDLLDSNDARWIAATGLDHGRKIMGIAELNRSVLPNMGDAGEHAKPFLFFRNGWDGGTSLGITIGVYRLVCTNGLTMPLKAHRRAWSTRHTSNVKERLSEARHVLDLSIGYITEFNLAAERMLATPVSTQQWEQFVQRLIPMPEPSADQVASDGGYQRKRMNVEQLRLTLDAVYRPNAHGIPTNGNLANITGTAWGAYNAVAEWADWHIGADRKINDERLLVRSIDDTTKHKARAVELLAAL